MEKYGIYISVSECISLLTMIISIICACSAYKQNKNMTNKSLKKTYFDLVFKSLLVDDFPKLIQEIEKMDNVEDFESICSNIEKKITDIIHSIKKYKYFNSNVYEELCETLSLIEESLYDFMEKMDNTKDNKEFDEYYELFMLKVDANVKHVYKILEEEYTC